MAPENWFLISVAESIADEIFLYCWPQPAGLTRAEVKMTLLEIELPRVERRMALEILEKHSEIVQMAPDVQGRELDTLLHQMEKVTQEEADKIIDRLYPVRGNDILIQGISSFVADILGHFTKPVFT